AGDDALTPVIVKATTALTDKLNQSVQAIVDSALKEFQAAQEQARKHAVPAIFGNNPAGDPKKNFGDWLSHAIKAITGKPRDALAAAEYLEKTYGTPVPDVQQKAALGESSGVTGGYTVPTQFSEQIQHLMAEETFIRPRAFVQPVTSAVMQ